MNEKINGIQKIGSYKAASGVNVYFIEQYRSDCYLWVNVGDCSTHKELIAALIQNNNYHVSLKNYIQS